MDKQTGSQTRHALTAGLLMFVTLVFFASFSSTRAAETPPTAPTVTEAEARPLFLPMIYAERPIAMPPPPPTATVMVNVIARQWDRRLDQRFAVLHEATPLPNQGYWRLIRARWYSETEAGGRHHVLVDILDEAGKRKVGVPVRIYWAGGETTIRTQAKPGEEYAADFDMHSIAPSYGAAPITDDAADDIWGMGMGSIELPFHTIHTSYGLVWQWTIQSGKPTETPTTTATPTATVTAVGTDTVPATPTGTATNTVTPSATAVGTDTIPATPVSTATDTVTPSATPAPRDWDERLDQRQVRLTEAEVEPGQGYWRLIRAVWYDEQESNGRHHIFVDLLDPAGQRIVDRPVRIFWNGGEAELHTQGKPGEAYAADFGMNSVGPSYGAAPAGSAPADSLWGMGLGSIEKPFFAIPTSYGFVWQWTIRPPAATAGQVGDGTHQDNDNIDRWSGNR